MSRRRLRRGHRSVDEETVGLAGWMYTDLLLGLAVVFLGAITFGVRGTSGDTAPTAPSSTLPGIPQTTVPPIVTTTTSPVELCTTLYASPAAQERKEDGIWVTVPTGGSDDSLLGEFLTQLEQQINDENKTFTDGRFIDPVNPQIGLVLAWGGYPSNGQPREGAQAAGRVLDRLRSVRPDLFASTGSRQLGTNSVRNGEVGLEIYPLVEGPCVS